MFAFARDGYGREIVALFVLTVLVTAAVAGGAGAVADLWFKSAVESLVGVPGEFDVIVHLQAQAGRGAVRELGERLEAIAPGTRLKEGPALLGRFNVFAGLPGEKRNAATFESLDAALRDLPGFDGISYIVEPSVLVKDAHPAVRQRFVDEAARDPRVRFTFQRGGNVWVVAEHAEAAEGVRARLEEAAGRLGILDVRFAGPHSAEELAVFARSVEEAAASEYPAIRVAHLGSGDSESVRDLLEVKRLLAGVAAADWQGLRRTLEQAEAAVAEAAQDSTVREDIAAALDAFEQAVAQLETLERRAVQLREQLKEVAGSDGGTGVLIALLLERLAAGLQGGQQEAAAPPAVDVERLKSGIASLAERLASIESLDFEPVIDEVRRLEESLAPLKDGAGERFLELIDKAIEAQGGEGTRVEFLLEGDWTRVDPAALVEEAAPGALKAFVRPAAAIESDPRTALSRLLARAVGAVRLAAGLLASAIFFLLDTVTIVSFLQLRPDGTGWAPRPRRAAAAALGGAWMAATFGAAAWLAGGGEWWAALVLGFVTGWLLACAAHRVAPVDADEVQAGLSLGLGGGEILREIVVPGGRPGILIWLNHFGRRIPAAARR